MLKEEDTMADDSSRLNIKEQERERGKKVNNKPIFFKYIRIKKLESKVDR